MHLGRRFVVVTEPALVVEVLRGRPEDVQERFGFTLAPTNLQVRLRPR